MVEYKKKYAQALIDFGRKMYTPAMIASEFSITLDEMQEWKDKYPEFKRNYERAEILAQAALERKGLQIIDNPRDFHHGQWAATMKARYPQVYDSNKNNQLAQIQPNSLQILIQNIGEHGSSPAQRIEQRNERVIEGEVIDDKGK